jgi:hypothetical protein
MLRHGNWLAAQWGQTLALEILITLLPLRRGHNLKRLTRLGRGREHLDQPLPVGADAPQLRTSVMFPNKSDPIVRNRSGLRLFLHCAAANPSQLRDNVSSTCITRIKSSQLQIPPLQPRSLKRAAVAHARHRVE